MTHNQCDCCGEMVPESDIRHVIAYGIETNACSKCRHEDEEEHEEEP